MVFVVLHPHVTRWKNREKEFEQDLKEHAKSRLPGFAQPEWVQILDDLPKVSENACNREIPLIVPLLQTSTGKIQKNVLRDRVKAMAKL
jgi:acyl-coenzyme A synthetase/AMP-(fatty) acid ligase